MFDNLMYLISGMSIIAPPVIFVVFLINALIHSGLQQGSLICDRLMLIDLNMGGITMEIVSAFMMAAYSLERFLDDLASFALFGFLPLLFVVFLILAIVQGVKVKKHGGKKAPMIVFIVLSAVFAVLTLCEVLLMLLLAAAIAHM